MAQDKDLDNLSSVGQPKRPPLDRLESDSQSDTTTTSGATSGHHRTKHHQKQHHVGRLHTRVPSSKTVHKHHAHGHTHAHAHGHGHGHSSKQPKRSHSGPTSPNLEPADSTSSRPQSHRRSTSDIKLPRARSGGNLTKNVSQSSLKRNRSSVEFGKRNKSSDKLKRVSSGAAVNRLKPNKTQVHFDLGSDDPDDEWVDASGSNSPYLSRKGSLNSSAQSSLRTGPSAENSRPATPSAHAPTAQAATAVVSGAHASNQETSKRKEYLTSRLLQRTPSAGAPPQMTADIASATPPQQPLHSGSSTERQVTPPSGHNVTPPSSGGADELVSRFVDAPSSGLPSSGSFYHVAPVGRRSLDEIPRRPNSMDFAGVQDSPGSSAIPVETDNSVLVPKAGRRTAAQSAERSRTQQKLNLQRASSVLEPGQTISGAGGGVGSSPLIGVGGPGFDGGNSRDPRIGKLLERTGMEYLVVRRYQNPIARSLNRLGRLPMEKTRRIPRSSTGLALANGKSPSETSRHTRNVSMPDPRQSNVSRRDASIRTNGTGSSLEGEEASRLSERLSGVSLGREEEENGTSVLLRNLWDKPLDLSASAD